MFTLAHTLTLGFAAAGWVTLPAQVVEPLIALSIAYVGLENIFAKKLGRHRLILVFLFGLLHGLGFAGVLLDFGMPKESFLSSLISFNVGVELGQLAVVGLALLCVGWLFRSDPEKYRRYVSNPASFLITLVGLMWTVERVMA